MKGQRKVDSYLPRSGIGEFGGNLQKELSMGLLKGSDTVPQQDSNGNLAVKLLRTFAAQTEALQRYRGKGQQKVTVEHVHVHTGGQAIVGSVSQSGGGRDNDENRGQPHAPENAGAITFAPGTALPSADEARDAMPVASGRR